MTGFVALASWMALGHLAATRNLPRHERHAAWQIAGVLIRSLWTVVRADRSRAAGQSSDRRQLHELPEQVPA